MAQSIFILGRQPALGLAELESRFGAPSVRPIGNYAALVDVEAGESQYEQLGGSSKVCRLLTILETTDWTAIVDYLVKNIPNHLQYLPEGKLQLGLSVFGFPLKINHLHSSGLKLKKVIKNAGRSVRLIPNKDLALNSAQVIHNHLTGPLGWEFVLVRDGKRTLLAQTYQEQAIEAYAARDQQRPKRDAKVGMLPPKLAQIIINLASPPPTGTVLDPFCGTGVIVQEALLMGYSVIGSDLSEVMVQYSMTNLEWLQSLQRSVGGSFTIEAGDATVRKWPPFDTVATETYLGQPLKVLPPSEVLAKNIADLDGLHRRFLANIRHQLPENARLCMAIPAWKTTKGFHHLPLLDHLGELGYNRVSFAHAKNGDLVYHRESQIVARELVVLVRN